MSNSQLPERASLEYLRKLAKDRLAALRRSDPHTSLATALLAVARDHGFPSWRALKAEIERRDAASLAGFFEACANGDLDRLRPLVDAQRRLARASDPRAPHAGWTGMHAAAKAGHADVARLLLEHGADPNAREAGDNTSPLHWAAAGAHVDTIRLLLDAGADVQGVADVHELDVIGWATFYQSPTEDPSAIDPSRRQMVALLVERGASHHIFSAMCVGDLSLIRDVVEQDPHALDRRLSRFEKQLTPLHFAIQRKRYDILGLLIELGADLDAVDGRGQTALTLAMLRGDRDAMQRLQAAGATLPAVAPPPAFRDTMATLAASVAKGVPMFYVPDVGRALDWYTSIGFTELARYEDDGLVNFGMVAFGRAELMLNMHGAAGKHDASVWFYTDQVDRLYEQLKARQLQAARASLAGKAVDTSPIVFEQEIEDMFYGARQFAIRDLNGYQLYFIQSR
jgi:ankyrin repeat protein